MKEFKKDFCSPTYITFKKESYNRWQDQISYFNELNDNIRIKKSELSFYGYNEETFCKEIIRYTINKKINLFLNDVSQKYKLNKSELIASIFPKWYIANINEIFFDKINFKKWCNGKKSNNMCKIKYYLNCIKEINLRCWILKEEFKNSFKYSNINELVRIFISDNVFNDLLESIKYLLYEKN